MGFQVPRRAARISFEEGHDYHGAEVVLNLDLPLHVLFEFQKLREAEPIEAVRLFAAEVLSSWNIEDASGASVPADFDGMCSQPAAFYTAVMDRWVSVATEAPTPLGQPSSDTGGSAAQSIRTGTE